MYVVFMDTLMIFASKFPSLRPDQGWFHEKDFTLRQVDSSAIFSWISNMASQKTIGKAEFGLQGKLYVKTCFFWCMGCMKWFTWGSGVGRQIFLHDSCCVSGGLLYCVECQTALGDAPCLRWVVSSAAWEWWDETNQYCIHHPGCAYTAKLSAGDSGGHVADSNQWEWLVTRYTWSGQGISSPAPSLKCGFARVEDLLRHKAVVYEIIFFLGI